MKSCALVPVLVPTVTAILPVVAPAGATALSWLREEAATVAGTPLKVTWFCDGVPLNPRPQRVTVVPVGPRVGARAEIPTGAFGSGKVPRMICRIFPTGSYT